MKAPESRKKKELIAAAIVLFVPLLFVGVRMLTHSNTNAPRQDTQQREPESARNSPTASSQAMKNSPSGFFVRVMDGLGLGSKAPADRADSSSKGTTSSLSGPSGVNGPSGSSVEQESIAKAPEKPVEPTEGCFTETFRHKKISGHDSEEACALHRNLIRLRYEHVSQVCIRVNRMPVAFQPAKGKQNEFIVGPIAGPHAEITARYCFGKTRCDEDCSIPKDDFMNAIGGNDDRKQVAQWDPGDAANKDNDVTAHLDADMKKELDHLDEKTADELFRGWTAGIETPACGTKHAMN